MEQDIKKRIKKDFQIKKFGLYGFLKNLKFFEPYMLIFLLSNNLTMFQIGILIGVRELVVNLFEVPSGIIADTIGRKKELYLCFSFYVLSFITFFFMNNFVLGLVAMTLFGLGEAFRSGTHKAMIYTYLDLEGLTSYKTYVYGRTRGASQLGTALSSIIGIILILFVKDVKLIFLLSTVPIIIDFILIITYPKALDKSFKSKDAKSFKLDLKKSLKDNKACKRLLINQALFSATITSIKDYVQPVLSIIIFTYGFIIFKDIDADQTLKIVLGIVYFIIGILGSVCSRSSYKLKQHIMVNKLLNYLYILLMIFLVVAFLLIKQPIVIIIVFILLNSLQSVRNPLFNDELDSNIEKSTRSTILSLSAQLKSILVMILSPILGIISDIYGIQYAILTLVILLLISYPLVYITNNHTSTKEIVKNTK